MVSVTLPEIEGAGRGRRLMSRLLVRKAAPASTRPRLSPITRAGFVVWVPFWLSLGIGAWFWLATEPEAETYAFCALVVLAAILARRLASRLAERGRLDWEAGERIMLGALAAGLVAAGFLLAGYRSHVVSAPILQFRYYGPIEGRVIDIDRSSRDRIRLLLDQVVLKNLAPDRTPARVRLSLMTEGALPVPGQRVMLTGHLGPPPGPAEPGGFDFRRNAWFERIGAIGYTRAPVMTVAEPRSDGALAMLRLRMTLSELMQSTIGGQSGAVASALITGDRSGISEATNEIMRISSLYHIISISGLHMSMLAAFAYGALRLIGVGLVACGGSVLWPLHKIAAAGAFLVATAYLLLSGGGVATERSYWMVAVMLGAILVGRRAISLRTVAIAGLIVLIANPEALTSPSFQMSFAATVALILAHGEWPRVSHRIPTLLHPLVLLLLTSLVAGLTTGPIAAAHFGRIAPYGMLANLLAVPVVGIIVMPMGVIAVMLAPFGLAAPALWLMGLGTSWMLWVAEVISGFGGADLIVPSPPNEVVPLLGIGMTLLALARWPQGGSGNVMRVTLRFGMPLLCLAFAFGIWSRAVRPPVLISASGDGIGIMTSAGRAVSKPTGGSFAIENWLESDGDGMNQKGAADRPLWSGPVTERSAWLTLGENPLRIVHLTGKTAEGKFEAHCQRDTLIVSDQRLDPAPRIWPCLVFDTGHLMRTGAVALLPGTARPKIVTVAELTGNRPWAGRPPPSRGQPSKLGRTPSQPPTGR